MASHLDVYASILGFQLQNWNWSSRKVHQKFLFCLITEKTHSWLVHHVHLQFKACLLIVFHVFHKCCVLYLPFFVWLLGQFEWERCVAMHSSTLQPDGMPRLSTSRKTVDSFIVKSFTLCVSIKKHITNFLKDVFYSLYKYLAEL